MTHDARYALSLHLSHAHADPSTIGKGLGLDCTGRGIRAGQPRSAPKGRPLDGVYARSYWSHSFKPRDAIELASHLIEICTQLEKASEFLLRHVREGGDAELYLGLFVDGNFDDVLPATLLKKLGSLGVDLRLDIYGQKLRQKLD